MAAILKMGQKLEVQLFFMALTFDIRGGTKSKKTESQTVLGGNPIWHMDYMP